MAQNSIAFSPSKFGENTSKAFRDPKLLLIFITFRKNILNQQLETCKTTFLGKRNLMRVQDYDEKSF